MCLNIFWPFFPLEIVDFLGGGFNIVYFHPYFGKWSNFDWYFSDGLKPPTSFRRKPIPFKISGFRTFWYASTLKFDEVFCFLLIDDPIPPRMKGANSFFPHCHLFISKVFSDFRTFGKWSNVTSDWYFKWVQTTTYPPWNKQFALKIHARKMRFVLELFFFFRAMLRECTQYLLGMSSTDVWRVFEKSLTSWKAPMCVQHLYK